MSPPAAPKCPPGTTRPLPPTATQQVEAALDALARAVPVRVVDNGVGITDAWGSVADDVQLELEPQRSMKRTIEVRPCDGDCLDLRITAEVVIRDGDLCVTIHGTAELVEYVDGVAVYEMEAG